MARGIDKRTILRSVKADYSGYRFGVPTVYKVLVLFLLNPGFRSVVIYRVQQRATQSGFHKVASLTSNLNQTITGAEFCIGCEIGPNLRVRHPIGIVIGGNVEIGCNLTIQQGVTIGEKYSESATHSGSPRIGNYVTIGANSVVVGELEIGDQVTIGAMSFVNSTFRTPGIVVGIPAKYVQRR